jgi:hypothetical protein
MNIKEVAGVPGGVEFKGGGYMIALDGVYADHGAELKRQGVGLEDKAVWPQHMAKRPS